MRTIKIFFSLLLSLTLAEAQAQFPTFWSNKIVTPTQYEYVNFLKGAVMPSDTVAGAPIRSVAIINGTLYVKGVSYWSAATGGVSAFSALTDVNVSGITNGQLSRWNTSTGRWNNFTPSIADINGWAGYRLFTPSDTTTPGLLTLHYLVTHPDSLHLNHGPGMWLSYADPAGKFIADKTFSNSGNVHFTTASDSSIFGTVDLTGQPASNISTGTFAAGRYGTTSIPLASLNATGFTGSGTKILADNGWISPSSGVTNISATRFATYYSVLSSTGIGSRIDTAKADSTGLISAYEQARISADYSARNDTATGGDSTAYAIGNTLIFKEFKVGPGLIRDHAQNYFGAHVDSNWVKGYADVSSAAAVTSLQLAGTSYVPTLTNSANLASSSTTGVQSIYSRNGNIVTVKLVASVTATAASQTTTLTVSLPINTSNVSQGLCGFGFVVTGGSTAMTPAYVALGATATATIWWGAPVNTAQSLIVVFQYTL